MGFVNLARSVETFSRFLPETVVRQILYGDKRAARIHVRRKNVTIMFSDIRGFTTISEMLSQTDLLTLLYMYLSEMTQIVETHGGVVSEAWPEFLFGSRTSCRQWEENMVPTIPTNRNLLISSHEHTSCSAA